MFTPPADTNISAPVTFTYTVRDTDGAISNAATVTVTVTEAPNVAPLAMNDVSPESVAIGSSLTIDVLSNDEDDSDSLDISSVVTSIASAEPQPDGTILFTPAAADTDISVPVTFTYTVRDTDGAISNAATVTVAVTEAPNVAPLAVADNVSVEMGASVSVAILSNDQDSDGELDVDSVSIVSAPATGAALLESDGTLVGTAIEYTHDGSGAVGDEVTFTYTVADEDGALSNVATVTVSITAVPNVAPVAANDDPQDAVAIGSSLTIDVLLNDDDNDGTLNVGLSLIHISEPTRPY